MTKKNLKEHRVLNCIPSNEKEKDWLIEHAIEAGLTSAKSIPVAMDLREDGWWKINDQGSTGSCVGWASTDSVMRWHLVKSLKVEKSKLLSIRFTWMASKEMDEFADRASTFIEEAGTSLKASLEILRKYGSVPELILPFNGQLYPGTEKAFYADAATRKLNSYFNLLTSSTNKLDIFRQWIANNGPVLTRLNVDQEWDNVGADGKLNNYYSDTTRGGHAIALVGYTKEYFVVRNSWGKGWAHNGYAFASNNYAEKAFDEAYGISL